MYASLLRLTIHSIIATTVALSHVGAMDTAEAPPPPQLVEITIGNETLNNRDTEANLGFLELTAFPLELVKLTALTELHLNSNKIHILSPEIGNLTALRKLDLGYNQLTALPVELGNLTMLKKLYLDHNKLTALPLEIGNLTALWRLYLGGNQMSAPPLTIVSLTALRSLQLACNQLSCVPSEIVNLTLLKELSVYGNPLKGPDSKWDKVIETPKQWGKLRLHCRIKRDVEVKTQLLISARLFDTASLLALLPREIINLFCTVHMHDSLSNF